MPSTLIKVVAGIGGATTIGGGAFIYLNYGNKKEEKKMNNPIQNNLPAKGTKAITELLREKGLAILGSEDTNGWKKNWDKFKADHEKANPIGDWAFSNWEEIKVKTDDTSDLKGICSKNSVKEAVNENSIIFRAVKRYCTNATD